MRKQLVLIGIAMIFLGCNDNKPAVVKNSPSPTSSSDITYTSPSVIPTNTPVPSENKDICEVTSMYDFSKLVEYTHNGYPDYYYDSRARISGFVYDNKGNPFSNAKVTIVPYFLTFDSNKNIDGFINSNLLLNTLKSGKIIDTLNVKCNTFKFNITTKTDEKGFYSIPVGYDFYSFYVRVEKAGYTTREKITYVKEELIYTNFGNSNSSTPSSFADDEPEYLQYEAIQDEPEINNITINSTPLDKVSRPISNKIIKKTETDSRMKVKESKTGYEMVLTFSEVVNKDTIHENLQILSLLDSKVILDKSNIALTWVDAMTIKANFSIDKKGKYNIFFKKPFEDLNGNKAISDRYFRTRSLQISENIIFEII